MLRSLLTIFVTVTMLMVVTSARAEGDDLVDACYKAVNADTDELACRLCQKAVDASSGSQQTIALINLGRCQEGRGELISALATYRRARATMAAGDERLTAVDRRIQETEPRIGVLKLDWSALPREATVTVDGVAATRASADLPADPGTHEVVITIAGHAEQVQRVELPAGGAIDVVLVGGPANTKPDAGLHAQTIAAIAVGAVGVLGLAAFAVTGGLALDRQATLDARCPAPDSGERTCADAEALAAAREGDTLNLVNAVSLGVGLAGVATALVLYFTTPSPSDEAVSMRVDVVPSAVSLTIGGAF